MFYCIILHAHARRVCICETKRRRCPGLSSRARSRHWDTHCTPSDLAAAALLLAPDDSNARQPLDLIERAQTLAPQRPELVWGTVIALFAALLSILAGRTFSDSRRVGAARWRSVPRREFEEFFRTYPTRLEVDPPFDQPGYRRILTDPNFGSGGQSRVAECRIGRTRSRYWVRAGLVRPLEHVQPASPQASPRS